jgi:hypothetical protein
MPIPDNPSPHFLSYYGRVFSRALQETEGIVRSPRVVGIVIGLSINAFAIWLHYAREGWGGVADKVRFFVTLLCANIIILILVFFVNFGRAPYLLYLEQASTIAEQKAKLDKCSDKRSTESSRTGTVPTRAGPIVDSKHKLADDAITFTAKVRRLYDNWDAISRKQMEERQKLENSPAPDELSQLKKRADISQSRSTSRREDDAVVNEYRDHFAVDARIFRSRLQNALPPGCVSSDRKNLYENPVNPMAIGMIADDLEKMAKLLKDHPENGCD